MTTAFITHDAFFRHQGHQGHPECPERLQSIQQQLDDVAAFDWLTRIDARAADRSLVERVHTTELIDQLHLLSPTSGLAQVDADTYLNAHSLEAAYLAAGGAAQAVEAVLEGRFNNAFCALRPPGHHAERHRSMGFCLFNNVAVAAASAVHDHALERVAIVDFDVHHGNGTEQIFAGDHQVLVCSTFQHPFYPFAGADSDADNLVNVPLAAGAGGAEFRAAIEQHWIPALDQFRPEFVLISAGFDAHAEDPLANVLLDEADFSWVTQRLLQVAAKHAGGRLVSCLEGGYALGALARSVLAHLRVLAGR